MILKVRDEGDCNLRMTLNISYDFEYIEVIVSLRNKKTGKVLTKVFNAADFAAALQFYRQTEEFFFGKEVAV